MLLTFFDEAFVVGYGVGADQIAGNVVHCFKHIENRINAQGQGDNDRYLIGGQAHSLQNDKEEH